MKKLLLFTQFFLSIGFVYSQNYKFEYPVRTAPTFNIDNLSEKTTLFDLCPDLWKNIIFNQKETYRLDSLREINNPLVYYTYPNAGYDKIVDYVSFEIVYVKSDKKLKLIGQGNKLSNDQINFIKNVELGSQIQIIIKLKSKYKVCGVAGDYFFEGFLPIIVVPYKEASFKGGQANLTDYINKTIFSNISNAKDFNNLSRILVKFTIEPNGNISNSKIIEPSLDIKINEMVIDKIKKMPKWEPAQNNKGVKVSEVIELYLGGNNHGC